MEVAFDAILDKGVDDAKVVDAAVELIEKVDMMPMKWTRASADPATGKRIARYELVPVVSIKKLKENRAYVVTGDCRSHVGILATFPVGHDGVNVLAASPSTRGALLDDFNTIQLGVVEIASIRLKSDVIVRRLFKSIPPLRRMSAYARNMDIASFRGAPAARSSRVAEKVWGECDVVLTSGENEDDELRHYVGRRR